MRDDRAWRIGTEAEVAWITCGWSRGRTISVAVPPVFEDYAMVAFPNTVEAWERHDRAILALLSQHSPDESWWLGYLETGADDIVFPDAPKVMLYAGWHYVLVEAGPLQAATWRQSGERHFWTGPLPNLMFPADRSWLVSALWDDDWTCIGGPAELLSRFVCHPDLDTRQVALGEDATPPGHRAL